MNRARRRVAIAVSRPGMRRTWQPFALVQESDRPELWAHQRDRIGNLLQVWLNNRFVVLVYARQYECSPGSAVALQLAIRHNDESEIRGWDDLQRIKNEIVGEHRVALEVYPAASNVIDQANMRHLFVLPAGVRTPFTIRGRWE